MKYRIIRCLACNSLMVSEKEYCETCELATTEWFNTLADMRGSDEELRKEAKYYGQEFTKEVQNVS